MQRLFLIFALLLASLPGWGQTFSAPVQTPATTTNICLNLSNNATCTLTLSSTGAGHLLFVETAARPSGTSVTTPANGQGCATWTHLSAMDFTDELGSPHKYWYCLSSTAGATSLNVTLTGVSGSSNSVLADLWEVPYSGGTVAVDNYCTAAYATAVASPLPACTISSISGSQDLLLASIELDNYVISAINGTGWVSDINSTWDIGFAHKLNTTTLTAPTGTLSGGSSDTYSTFAVAFKLTASAATVTWTSPEQTIDGFGGSAVYQGTQNGTTCSTCIATGYSTALADFFFRSDTGIGLSIVRTQIFPDYTTCVNDSGGLWPCETSSGGTDNTGEVMIAQQAKARGVTTFIASEWSPPAAMKSNGSYSSGGSFNGGTSNYTTLAADLAGYASMMAAQGIQLTALSPQNEPDISQSYPSCTWTAQQLHDFVPYLYSALAGTGTEIMMPEATYWAGDYSTYAATTMNDAAVAPDVGVMAEHGYVTSANISALNNYSRRLWMTEDADQSSSYDGSITEALTYAVDIHDYLTVSNVSAYVWWYLDGGSTYGANRSDNEALTDINDNPAKRAYVIGQWSKFVRPGWHRVDVANPGSLLLTAFLSASGTQSAIVAVNTTSSAVNQTFSVGTTMGASVTPWITDATRSLAAQAPVSIASGSFTYSVPADSVVSLVGSTRPYTLTLLGVGQ